MDKYVRSTPGDMAKTTSDDPSPREGKPIYGILINSMDRIQLSNHVERQQQLRRMRRVLKRKKQPSEYTEQDFRRCISGTSVPMDSEGRGKCGKLLLKPSAEETSASLTTWNVWTRYRIQSIEALCHKILDNV